jgi:hypothetical protein
VKTEKIKIYVYLVGKFREKIWLNVPKDWKGDLENLWFSLGYAKIMTSFELLEVRPYLQGFLAAGWLRDFGIARFVTWSDSLFKR